MRLLRRALGGVDEQDRAVHLRRAGDHVLHVVGVAGTVDVRVVARIGFVLDVRGVDGDAASLFFGRAVDLIERQAFAAKALGLNLRDRSGQGRLAVVDVADSADVYMHFAHFITLASFKSAAGLE
jgi:hypothetical protein